MMTSRRGLLKLILRTFWMLASATLGSLLYALHIEPSRVTIEHITIPLRRLPRQFDDMKIVQISDLHFGGWMNGERMKGLAAQVNELGADCIVITGDFTNRINNAISCQITESLAELAACDGVYAILGNHDHWTDLQAVIKAIQEAGIQLMLNEAAVIERDGQRLYIAGIDDIWENKQDLDAALKDIPADSCVILLAHEPDYADTVANDGRIDLQLSGHSHGGQIRLPFIGAPVLPLLAKNYDQGLYTIRELKLYVNRGLGMLEPPVRFRCPSEITCITLRSTE